MLDVESICLAKKFKKTHDLEISLLTLVGLQSFDEGQEIFGFGKYKDFTLLIGKVSDLEIET